MFFIEIIFIDLNFIPRHFIQFFPIIIGKIMGNEPWPVTGCLNCLHVNLT